MKIQEETDGDHRFAQEGAIIGGKYLTPNFGFGYEYLNYYFPYQDQKMLICYYLTVGYYDIGIKKFKKDGTKLVMGPTLYKRFMEHCGIRRVYRWFYKMMYRLNFIFNELKIAEQNFDFKKISEIKNGFLDVQGRTMKLKRSIRNEENTKTIKSLNTAVGEWSGLD